MNIPETLYEPRLTSLPHRCSGKVREIFEIDDSHLLIVTTDRISAFDVVLPDPIPGKGRVLTSVSTFWFNRLQHLVPNHLSSMTLKQAVADMNERAQIEGRAMVVRKMTPLPVEAIVRGYLIGSGWKDYQKTGRVCGIELPRRLQLAERLPEPIYTPSTKAEIGQHDENIPYQRTQQLLGSDTARNVRDISLKLYSQAAEYARRCGVIIADTKFEFGLDEAGTLHLIDEALTPDSSRFWPADQYRLGISPPSFDKQYIRDYLEGLHWNKAPPAPTLPAEIIAKSAAKYREAEARLLQGPTTVS